MLNCDEATGRHTSVLFVDFCGLSRIAFCGINSCFPDRLQIMPRHM